MNNVSNRKRRFVFLALLALVACCFTLPSCVFNVHAGESRDYGPKQTEQRDLSGFTGVDAGGVFDIDIEYGEEYSVSIQAGQELLPLIDTKVRDESLQIKFNKSVRDVGDVNVRIIMPELDHLDLSGASSVVVGQGFKTTKFKVDMSGAASCQLEIIANKLVADLSGASDLELSGSADVFDLEGSGAADIDAEDFVTNNASVDLSGASDAHLNVSGELVVDASGASDVWCVSTPSQIRVDTSGASDIDC